MWLVIKQRLHKAQKKNISSANLSLGHPTTSNNVESELANIPMIIKGIGITIKAVIATIFRKLASQDSNT